MSNLLYQLKRYYKEYKMVRNSLILLCVFVVFISVAECCQTCGGNGMNDKLIYKVLQTKCTQVTSDRTNKCEWHRYGMAAHTDVVSSSAYILCRLSIQLNKLCYSFELILVFNKTFLHLKFHKICFRNLLISLKNYINLYN